MAVSAPLEHPTIQGAFYPVSGRQTGAAPPPLRQEASRPTHVYHPTRSPVSWWDRLLVHPIDSAVAVLAVMFVSLAALSMVTGGFTPSKSLDSMPTLVVWLFTLFLVTGDVLALLGLNWSGDDVSTG